MLPDVLVPFDNMRHTRACDARRARAPRCLTPSPDTHEPHSVVRSSSSKCPQPPGLCSEPKDIATTVLRGAQQHTLSSTQEAMDAQGKRSAPLAIWTKRHERRASLT